MSVTTVDDELRERCEFDAFDVQAFDSDYEELWPDNLTDTPAQSEVSTIDHRADTPSDVDTPDSPAKDESVDIDPSGDGVEAFTAMYARQAKEAKVPQDDLFQAYSNWTDQHDIDGTTKAGSLGSYGM